MSKARSGRFAGARSAAFVALNSSLALDWRLWPEDIEGSAAHARALRRAGVLDAAELAAIEDGLDSGRRRDRERRLRAPRRRRRRPHGRRAAPHRARGGAGSEAPYGAQPQRPGRHRRAAAPAPRDLRPARRPARAAGVAAGPGRAARRDRDARLHAPAARPGHLARPAPAGLVLDARARPRQVHRRPRRLPRAAARRRRRRGPELRPRPGGGRHRPRLRAGRAQLARRGRRSRLRGRLPGGRGAARRPSEPHRRRDRPVGDRRVRLRRRCPTR